MRVKSEHVIFFKQSIKKYLPDADVYLFGSRANEKLRGGDIDILVIKKKAVNNPTWWTFGVASQISYCILSETIFFNQEAGWGD